MSSLRHILISATVLLSMGSFPIPVSAQTEQSQKSVENPARRIEIESRGNVKIDIPENILDLIISDADAQKKQSGPTLRPGINKLSGYRVQVFSDGRSQHSLEARAKARGSAIVSRFPKYRGQIYSFSSAPNWYTRVGNFRTSEEASRALAELKRAFPQFASEMRVVRSQIVVIK